SPTSCVASPTRTSPCSIRGAPRRTTRATRTASMEMTSRRSRGRPTSTRPVTCAGRRRSSKRSSPYYSTPATTLPAYALNASDQPEDEMTDHVDGNALAGPLSNLFMPDLTTATAVCAGCGRSDVLAAGAVYGAPMGLIVRCPVCDGTLLRYSETP